MLLLALSLSLSMYNVRICVFCSLFMVSFLYPKTWLLYVASGVMGAGAALIWTGQGSYLSRCSNESNIARNSGVFWAMLQARCVFHLIPHHTRTNVCILFAFRSLTLCFPITTACWWAIRLCSSNSKGRIKSMPTHGILFLPCSLRLQSLVLYSSVCCAVFITHSKKMNVTENWTMHRIAIVLLGHLLKPSNCSSHVTCYCCVSLSSIQVNI